MRRLELHTGNLSKNKSSSQATMEKAWERIPTPRPVATKRHSGAVHPKFFCVFLNFVVPKKIILNI